jgi:hypothetical protein
MIMMSIDGMHKEKYEKKKNYKIHKRKCFERGGGKENCEVDATRVVGFSNEDGSSHSLIVFN